LNLDMEGVAVSAFLEPAKFVAGDLYDILGLEGKKTGVFIGDVSGKGIPASLIMAQTISLFRIFARRYTRPAEVLEALNKELYGKFEGRFVTCLYLIIDKKRRSATVASAGHGPLLLYGKEDSRLTEADLKADVPLGIMEDTAYSDVLLDFRQGDKIVVFTDGVPEARNRMRQEFGLDTIKRIILKDAGLSAEALAQDIGLEVRRFSSGAPQHDDITLMVLENK